MLQSDNFVAAVVANSEGVGYPAIAPSRLACLPVWVPPGVEQEAIATFLDGELEKVDSLISRIGDNIEEIRAYRAALISAAVTGKIDRAECVERRRLSASDERPTLAAG